MKLRRLRIDNYKSLRSIDLELGEDLNVLVGKNNSGKSNVLDALALLSRLMQGRNVSDALTEYGGFREIVFGKNAEERITFNLEFAFSEDDISFLFRKLNAVPDVSMDKFHEALNKASYLLQLEESRMIAFEEVHIDYDKKDIIYGRGGYRDGGYQRDLIEDFKEGVIKGTGKFKPYGGGSPASPILLEPTRHTPISPEENLLWLIQRFMSSFASLAPVRQSPEIHQVYGAFQLNPSGDNLMQVLNSMGTSNRRVFERIMGSAGEIIGETEEIRAPLIERTQKIYVSVVEKAFKDTEFSWRNIASGTKEILFLVTLFHTTPKGSLLMVEEPELHLHVDAVRKLLSLADRVCGEDHKQMVITTHSPTLIDALPFEKIFAVTKENGETKVEPLKEGSNFENMLLQAGVPKSWLLQRKLPLFLLIVDSREDVKIWSKFLERKKIDLKRIRVVRSGEPGGGTKDIEIGKFLKKARMPIPFMIVRDSDNEKREKEEALENAGFEQEEYHVLSRKEIEDYLLDPKAISGIIGRNVEEVEEQLEKAKGKGKTKLENLFKLFRLSDPDEGMKELLASRVEIEEEITSIIDRIREIADRIS